MRARQRLQRGAALRRGPLRVARAGTASQRVLTALALTTLLAATAHAQESPLAAADRAYAAERWAEAGRAYEDALAAGDLETPDWTRAHFRLGRIAFIGAQPGRARRHLARALALEPGRPTPDGWPPDLVALVEEARAAQGGRALAVALTIGAPTSPVQIEVSGAPDMLVTTLIVEGAAGFSRTLAYSAEPLELSLPVGSAPWAVRALDASGNVLARAGVAPPALPPTSEPPAHEPEPQSTPDLLENPWLWVVVGLLAVGIGLVVGLTAFEERTALGAPVIGLGGSP